MTDTKTYVYLDNILPDLEIDYEYYTDCEQNDITPALRELGYEIRDYAFRTGDGDSFGPLTRVATCTNPQGEQVEVVYG